MGGGEGAVGVDWCGHIESGTPQGSPHQQAHSSPGGAPNEKKKCMETATMPTPKAKLRVSACPNSAALMTPAAGDGW